MRILIKRFIDLRKFAVLFAIIAFAMIVNVQKAYAEEQQDNPYLIKVNRVFNTITIYEKGDGDDYDIPVKAMACSVGKAGTQTRKGTFQTKGKYRWKSLMGDVWGQYSTRIVGGILFHSVYYYKGYNPGSLATNEYNKLGTSASHGCIRLTVEDAKWIFDNCPVGTTVVIYDDAKSPGPLGKPKTIKLPATVRWDPTDPSEENPYRDKKPIISGAKNLAVSWGKEFDLLKGVKAKSSVGTDISSQLIAAGEVNIYLAGDYSVTYKVSDALGRTGTKTVKVTVKESKKPPIFEGIKDHVVSADTVIDEAYVLTGIKVSCSGIPLNSKDIVITIAQVSEVQYQVTYSMSVGKKVTATEHATYYIDNEAPVFAGVSDRILDEGQIPDGAFALTGVSVSDNYTSMDQNDIVVTIEQNPEGGFFVTYEAKDEVGNVVKETVNFNYNQDNGVEQFFPDSEG